MLKNNKGNERGGAAKQHADLGGESVTNTLRPTKELLASATTAEVCKMIQTYRDTNYHETFLRLLFNLPLDVWTENDLLPDYILGTLNWEEKQKLCKLYEMDDEKKQNPLITMILHQHR